MPVNALTPIAVITRPKGLQGEVHLRILDGFSGEVLQAGPVFLEVHGQRIPHLLERVEHTAASMARAMLKGVGSREQAELLRGTSVLVAADVAEAYRRGDGEWMDYTVFSGTQRLGKVSGLVSTSAQDLIEVTSEEGREWLIPFVEAFIVRIDDRAKTIELNLPEGLLDLGT